jgi:exoribonuclease II
MDADRRRERRLFERVPTRIFVTLALKNQGWEFQQNARAVDISRGGLRIRTEPPLDEGQGVYLFSDAGLWHPRSCRVVWVRAGRPEQQCEAGLEFLSRLLA